MYIWPRLSGSAAVLTGKYLYYAAMYYGYLLLIVWMGTDFLCTNLIFYDIHEEAYFHVFAKLDIKLGH